MMRAALCVLVFAAFAPLGCRDVQHFSTAGDHFEGTVVASSFVRTGIAEDARACLTLDTDHLQDAPGAISSTDGRFHATPLRPIPQLWHDPLSTLTFGEGRVKTLVYAATPTSDAGDTQDVLVVISLMQSKSVELRLVRGAPGADPLASNAAPVFGVFTLDRQGGACSF